MEGELKYDNDNDIERNVINRDFVYLSLNQQQLPPVASLGLDARGRGTKIHENFLSNIK